MMGSWRQFVSLAVVPIACGGDNDGRGELACELGDECDDASDCPERQCNTGGPVMITTSSCLDGRCVLDECVCKESTIYCCYPELERPPGEGPPTRYDGEWTGTTDQGGNLHFTIEDGDLLNLQFEWTVSCAPPPPKEEPPGEPMDLSGTETTEIHAGDARISEEGLIVWASPAATDLTYSLNISCDSKSTASGFVHLTVFEGCASFGTAEITFDATRF